MSKIETAMMEQINDVTELELNGVIAGLVGPSNVGEMDSIFSDFKKAESHTARVKYGRIVLNFLSKHGIQVLIARNERNRIGKRTPMCFNIFQYGTEMGSVKMSRRERVMNI